MEEKITRAKEILEKYGQEHLLKFYSELSDEKKSKLLDDILTIDFKQLQELYESTKMKQNYENGKIEPIAYKSKENLSKEELDKYTKIGEEAIRQGKLAVVTMAGGQGTRLGHSGPKGTYDIGLASHKSIFEILCDNFKEAKEKYQVTIPWYLMTSEENNDDTIAFFEQNNYFGYPKEAVKFFKQGTLPMIDTNGKVLLNEEKMIKQAADGHGGVFEAMRKNGIIYDMSQKGIEWVFISGVDNVLVKPIDAVLTGLATDEGMLMAAKSIVKAGPDEKVGVFCKKDGKPYVVEYIDISEEMANQRNENGELVYGESHILCNQFNIKILEKLASNKLPYHVAFKKASYINENGEIVKPEKPNAYKFESFLFDAFSLLPDIAILRVKREEEFAPVKNATGVDSAESARELYNKFHNL